MQRTFQELEVKLSDNKRQTRAAQRLRAEVFGKAGLDADEYDEYSDHLIVVDKAKRLVVGTYRLMPCFKATKTGFHAEKIFRLDNIKRIKENIAEMGRSCVHPDYRKSLVINLLWQGIAAYARQNGVRFFFGCPRLATYDIRQISKEFKFLKEKFYAAEKYRVEPLEDCRINIIEDIDVEDEDAVLHKLPALIKGYLRAGANVCGPPALNKEFNSIVIFMLLDFKQLNEKYNRRFLKGQ